MRYEKIKVNERLLLEVHYNRRSMGALIYEGDLDQLVEFWQKVARPAIWKVLQTKERND
jgi:hypothetical protein